MKPSLCTILGTRPEIVKCSPLLGPLDRRFRHTLIHTGQHYDAALDGAFFEDLRLRQPDHRLTVGSAPHAEQTARILSGLEPILARLRPDWVLVQGDTNSALAGALTAAKLGLSVVHLEAGCRSFVRTMPEEINRVLIAQLARLHLAPDRLAVSHLRAEGIDLATIHDVGNTGLDATQRTLKLAGKERSRRFGVRPEGYLLATMHRAENTDDPQRLAGLVEALNRLSGEMPLLIPVHPRTRAAMVRDGLSWAEGVRELPPLGPLDFVGLLRDCLLVLSDSGGVQEEAAVLNRPCLILREETEWQRLVTARKNFLAGVQPDGVVELALRLIRSPARRERIRARPAPLRFGATDRVLDLLLGR
jgi:UDP-N-acetylglucosamine 2-epimerase